MNDLKRDNLKGRIQSIKKTTYLSEEKFGEPEKSDLVFVDNCSYNRDGNVVQEDIFNKKGELTDRIKYLYDFDGKVKEDLTYTPDGKLRLKSIYISDGNGNKKELKRYSSSGELVFSVTSKFDKSGKVLTQQESYPDMNIKIEKNFKYGDGGDLIEEEQNEDRKGEETREIYEFKYSNLDKSKNWTRKVAFRNKKADYIIEQTIEYFE